MISKELSQEFIRQARSVKGPRSIILTGTSKTDLLEAATEYAEKFRTPAIVDAVELLKDFQLRGQMEMKISELFQANKGGAIIIQNIGNTQDDTLLQKIKTPLARREIVFILTGTHEEMYHIMQNEPALKGRMIHLRLDEEKMKPQDLPQPKM